MSGQGERSVAHAISNDSCEPTIMKSCCKQNSVTSSWFFGSSVEVNSCSGKIRSEQMKQSSGKRLRIGCKLVREHGLLVCIRPV